VVKAGSDTYGARVSRDGREQCWPREDINEYEPGIDDEEEMFND